MTLETFQILTEAVKLLTAVLTLVVAYLTYRTTERKNATETHEHERTKSTEIEPGRPAVSERNTSGTDEKTEPKTGASRDGETRRREQLRISALLLGASVLAMVGLSLARPGPSAVSRALAANFPGPFSGSKTGEYLPARLLRDKDETVRQTDFSGDLLVTDFTFDFVAISGAVFQQHYTALEELLRKAPARRVRILLVDPDSAAGMPRAALRALGIDGSLLRAKVDATLDQLRYLAERVSKTPNDFPGTLEVRLLPGALPYSGWVRDAGTHGACAHLSVLLYGLVGEGPAFRLSDPVVVQNLSRSFNAAWIDAKIVTPVPQSSDRP